jgi:hypothetical protein
MLKTKRILRKKYIKKSCKLYFVTIVNSTFQTLVPFIYMNFGGVLTKLRLHFSFCNYKSISP